MTHKILHIITRLDTGGSSTNTIETVARLDKNKYQVKLLFGKTHDPDGNIVRSLKERNIDYQCIKTLVRSVNPVKDILTLWQMVCLIKKGKYDLIHTHSSKAGILGRWAAKLANAPCIVHTPHGHVFYGYFNGFLNIVFIWVEKLTAVVTDKIITLTQKGKEEHVQFGIAKADKFIPIYSGIDIEHYRNKEIHVQNKRKEWGIHPDAFVFGCIARLDEIKGNRYLVDAFIESHQQMPGSQLILVGEGEERKMIEEKIEQNKIQDKIILAGERHDIDEFLLLIDVFVLASLNEGMGRVILEAMACGKPVIATDTGGIPELVKNRVNGFLVPVKDAKGISAAMLKFFERPELVHDYGLNNKRKVEEKFGIKNMVEEIDHLYESLIKAKK